MWNLRVSHIAILAIMMCYFGPAPAMAEPVCTFKDTGHRRIDHTNPDDWRCMNLLAANGDAYWQYYIGLQLVWGFDPDEKRPAQYKKSLRGNSEGIRLLQKAARSNNANAAANARRILGHIYLGEISDYDVGLTNYELAYQWKLLAAELYKDEPPILAGEMAVIGHHVSPERMNELRENAHELLRESNR